MCFTGFGYSLLTALTWLLSPYCSLWLIYSLLTVGLVTLSSLLSSAWLLSPHYFDLVTLSPLLLALNYFDSVTLSSLL